MENLNALLESHQEWMYGGNSHRKIILYSLQEVRSSQQVAEDHQAICCEPSGPSPIEVCEIFDVEVFGVYCSIEDRPHDSSKTSDVHPSQSTVKACGNLIQLGHLKIDEVVELHQAKSRPILGPKVLDTS